MEIQPTATTTPDEGTAGTAQPFASRAGFQQALRDCIGRARLTLQCFDPDFTIWELGTAETDALLRRFLAGHGKLELVAHDFGALERQAPRLLRLLRDYGHAIECRLTGKQLRHLTDSFCIADGRHLVRRYHADHVRGEAIYDAPPATQLCKERYTAIWAETMPGLHANTTGL